MNPLERKGSIEQQGRAFELAETQETVMPFIKSGAHVASSSIKDYLAYKETSKLNQQPLIKLSIAGIGLGGIASLSNPIAGAGVMLGAMGIGLAVTGFLEGADYLIKGVARGLDTFSTSKTNPAKLRQDIIERAKENNTVPDEFWDPVSYKVIEDPVTFVGDPTQTIYDRDTVERLRGAAREGTGVLLGRKGGDRITNPMTGSGQLDCDLIISLPGVKEQIEDLKKHFGGTFPS